MDYTELADIVVTIHEMTDAEAIASGVPIEDRWRYFRVDTLKSPDRDAPPDA